MHQLKSWLLMTSSENYRNYFLLIFPNIVFILCLFVWPFLGFNQTKHLSKILQGLQRTDSYDAVSVPPRVTHLIADLHRFNHQVKTSRMYWFSKPLAPTPRAQSTLRLHLKSTVQNFVFVVTHLHDVPTNILDKHTDMTPFYSVITTSKRATSICTLRHGHSCLSQALCCSLWYKCITRFKVKGRGVETGPFERLQSSSLQWGKLSFIFTFLSLSPFSLILSSFYFIYFSYTLKKNKK